MDSSYQSLINDATQLLMVHSDTPRIDAEVLMQHTVGKPLAWLIAYGDAIATPDHNKQFMNLIADRRKGKPIAYLTGHKEFWTLNLRVNQDVLIPRADTETVVEQCLTRLDKTISPRILDLGTGSGAIALSIAKEKPDAIVVAVDSQTRALAVAEGNAQLNNIPNVEFLQSDWFSALDGSYFDLIVANPPYVDRHDEHLLQGDLRYEPTSALVSGENGYGDIRQIIEGARSHLSPGGWLALEHGYQQADEVSNYFRRNNFTQLSLHHDINNLPRCTLGQIAANN